MATDNRESFPSLEDASGNGSVLRQVQIGDSATGKNGSIALSFVDTNNNLTAPQLTAGGRIPVETNADGNPFKGRGEVVAGAASGSFATVVSISVNPSKKYVNIQGNVSCRRAALFQLVHNDNGTLNVLADYMVDAGQYTYKINQETMQVNSGTGATQAIFIRAFNLDNQQSNLRSNLSVVEVVP